MTSFTVLFFQAGSEIVIASTAYMGGETEVKTITGQPVTSNGKTTLQLNEGLKYKHLCAFCQICTSFMYSRTPPEGVPII